LSNIYLVRHGQAGTRDDYDRLSDVGRYQARLLGEYFASQGLVFSAAYSGFMRRQQETGAEVQAVFTQRGARFPDLEPKQEWDEFDLDYIYRELAPPMCKDDSEFRRQYEEMREQVRASGGVEQSAVHRRWLPCDAQIVRAWIEGKYPYTGESWHAFLDRVGSFRHALQNGARDANVVVFTSAVPVAIWAGLALEIADRRIMRLAGVMHNTAYTVVRLKADDLRLLSFNATPHLDRDYLRTYR
jgi:broad specificity phosphatase PhoE